MTARVEPVEYAVAVDRYLSEARISPASARVYRIALGTWAWLLVERTPPGGPARRTAVPPVLLLDRLDGPDSAALIRRALQDRAALVDRRTLAREIAILRTAVRWWFKRGWIGTDAQLALRDASMPAQPSGAGALSAAEVRAVLTLRAPLREQTLWHLTHESGAPIGLLLRLNVSDLDLAHRRVRRRAQPSRAERIAWGEATAELLPLLLIGRTAGPVFRTERRAPARVPDEDRCPYTGHGRLSPRRAAELFRAATAPLDPAGRGWTLRDLRLTAHRTPAR